MSFDLSHLRWVFGHGSVMFRPGFAHAARVKATVPGWERRFGQPSIRNWGSPGAPAPTCSLVPGEEVVGVAFGVEPQDLPTVLGALLEREAQDPIEVRMDVDGVAFDAFTWPMSSAWAHLDPEQLAQAALENVSAGGGPAGHAIDYLRGVAGALDQIGAVDRLTGAYVKQADLVLSGGLGAPSSSGPVRWPGP